MKIDWKDIRVWIVFLFVLRLYGITNAPVEVEHNWRQTTVAMVARNFYEIDANILYPRVDMAGEKTGITGMEFPLFNYLIYLVSLVFGYDHWYGRLINLVVSSFGLWYFFKLVRDEFSERVGYFSTLVLAVSLWFSYSRKIMPDTFAVSLVMIGAYHWKCYLKSENKLHFMQGVLWSMVGVLSKLPSGLILLYPLLFMINYRHDRKKVFVVLSGLIITVLPSVYWYFIHVPYLVETYGYWHFFMGESFAIGWQEVQESWGAIMKRFYDGALKYIGFGLFLGGIVVGVLRRESKLMWMLIGGSALFFVFIVKSGDNFGRHSYYVLPFIPVMSVVAGYFIDQIPRRVGYVLVGLVVVEGILNQHHDFHFREEDRYLVEMEGILSAQCGEGLFVVNSGEYPTPLYFAHRRGWVMGNSEMLEAGRIDSLRELGLRYVMVLEGRFGEGVELGLEEVVRGEGWVVYGVGG